MSIFPVRGFLFPFNLMVAALFFFLLISIFLSEVILFEYCGVLGCRQLCHLEMAKQANLLRPGMTHRQPALVIWVDRANPPQLVVMDLKDRKVAE